MVRPLGSQRKPWSPISTRMSKAGGIWNTMPFREREPAPHCSALQKVAKIVGILNIASMQTRSALAAPIVAIKRLPKGSPFASMNFGGFQGPGRVIANPAAQLFEDLIAFR